jgi:hypothetical protein
LVRRLRREIRLPEEADEAEAAEAAVGEAELE